MINNHPRFYDIMENYITRLVSPSNNINYSGYCSHPSNMKLENQKILECLGQIEWWKHWNQGLNVLYMGKVIIKFYPMLYFDFKQRNCIIYSQLPVATVGVSNHNLVKRFKYTNVGNAAWNSMCECYDWNVIKMKLKIPYDHNYKATTLHCHQIQKIT